MMVGSRLQWSLRHTRQRLFESILIILAVGLGVAVIVTVVSVFAGIDTQMDTLLANAASACLKCAVPWTRFPYRRCLRHVFEEKVELSITYGICKLCRAAFPSMHVFIDNYRMQVTTPLLKTGEQL